MRLGDEASEWVNIERGMRQSCVLSPDLFSLSTQLVIQKFRDLDDVSIGERNINGIRYADDVVLIGDSEEQLHNLAVSLREGWISK